MALIMLYFEKQKIIRNWGKISRGSSVTCFLIICTKSPYLQPPQLFFFQLWLSRSLQLRLVTFFLPSFPLAQRKSDTIKKKFTSKIIFCATFSTKITFLHGAFKLLFRFQSGTNFFLEKSVLTIFYACIYLISD